MCSNNKYGRRILPYSCQTVVRCAFNTVCSTILLSNCCWLCIWLLLCYMRVCFLNVRLSNLVLLCNEFCYARARALLAQSGHFCASRSATRACCYHTFVNMFTVHQALVHAHVFSYCRCFGQTFACCAFSFGKRDFVTIILSVFLMLCFEFCYAPMRMLQQTFVKHVCAVCVSLPRARFLSSFCQTFCCCSWGFATRMMHHIAGDAPARARLSYFCQTFWSRCAMSFAVRFATRARARFSLLLSNMWLLRIQPGYARRTFVTRFAMECWRMRVLLRTFVEHVCAVRISLSQAHVLSYFCQTFRC